MLSTRRQWLRRALVCALVAFAAGPLFAQAIAPTEIKFAATGPTSSHGDSAPLAPPAFPDWPDQASHAMGPAPNQSSIAPAPFTPPADATPAIRAAERAPSFVTPASAETPMASTTAPGNTTTSPAPALDGLCPARDPRQLGPPPKSNVATPDSSFIHPAASHGFLPNFGMPVETMYTTGTATALVVGLFMLCAWALRRGARKSAVLLSSDVAHVLGRVPLAARQFAELVHIGNKLVLLSVTASGAELLTEITDPVEVDRLLGICKQKDNQSSTVEFDEMFRQLSEETAPDGFLGDEAVRFDTRPVARSAAGAYAAQQGGRRSA
jgi:flagellar biogenesis protein FliO